MKIKKLQIFIVLLASTVFISNANASENVDPGPVGGFAVVNPETGVVHGVIVGSIEYFGNNDKTMGHEYMGCPVGCLIIQQSTASQSGNVSGIGGPNVTYNSDRNVFQVSKPDVIQTETVIESTSNTSIIQTEISVSRSMRNYEFGVLDMTKNDGFGQIIEVAPSQNTSAEVSAITKELVCEESALLCSSTRSSGSNILVNESVFFDQRSSATQVETKVVVEVKNKIREQLSLILSMLERWILN